MKLFIVGNIKISAFLYFQLQKYEEFCHHRRQSHSYRGFRSPIFVQTKTEPSLALHSLLQCFSNLYN